MITNHLHFSHIKLLLLSSISLLLIPSTVLVSADCTCTQDDDQSSPTNKSEALKFKLVAIASVLGSGAVGVSLPLLGRKFESLRPENDMFFMIKAFAAGVILATGFVHILPDAFATLTSPCLGKNPWGKFPFAGLVAMTAAIGTLMVDTVATTFYKNVHFTKSSNNKQVSYVDEEAHGDDGNGHDGHVHVHTHATHGHAHGAAPVDPSHDVSLSDLVRQRIISQVCIYASLIILALSNYVLEITNWCVCMCVCVFFVGFGAGDSGALGNNRDIARRFREP